MKHGKMILGELHADIPVIQGGMGVGISLSGLAGAVAAAGGIGIISTARFGSGSRILTEIPSPVICVLSEKK